MKKILFVEDDLFIQEIYIRVFTQAGYALELAKDGEEALEKAKSDTYDAILLDIMLPKVNGINVLSMMRMPGAPTENTPIFLITNLGQESVIEEAFRIGADGYFIKAQMNPKNIIIEIEKFLAKDKAVSST
ncbi:MAG TPA: response regulator [Xanthomonadales bacterium]|nr:response regulator [Xanthomonadales bacterium]